MENKLYTKSHWWCISFNFGVEYVLGGMTETEIVAMYHTLARVCNKEFGTTFEYSESEIERCGNYKHRNFRFGIRKSNYRDVWRIESIEDDLGLNYHRYWVEYVGRETIIRFVQFLYDWLSENDIHYLTYLTYKEYWLSHKGFGKAYVYGMLDKYYYDCYSKDEDFINL